MPNRKRKQPVCGDHSAHCHQLKNLFGKRVGLWTFSGLTLWCFARLRTILGNEEIAFHRAARLMRLVANVIHNVYTYIHTLHMSDKTQKLIVNKTTLLMILIISQGR